MATRERTRTPVRALRGLREDRVAAGSRSDQGLWSEEFGIAMTPEALEQAREQEATYQSNVTALQGSIADQEALIASERERYEMEAAKGGIEGSLEDYAKEYWNEYKASDESPLVKVQVIDPEDYWSIRPAGGNEEKWGSFESMVHSMDLDSVDWQDSEDWVEDTVSTGYYWEGGVKRDTKDVGIRYKTVYLPEESLLALQSMQEDRGGNKITNYGMLEKDGTYYVMPTDTTSNISATIGKTTLDTPYSSNIELYTESLPQSVYNSWYSQVTDPEMEGNLLDAYSARSSSLGSFLAEIEAAESELSTVQADLAESIRQHDATLADVRATGQRRKETLTEILGL